MVCYGLSFPVYFNSRPRVGGVLKIRQTGSGTVAISILAPAWGASIPASTSPELHGISILAPAWGASAVCNRHGRGILISILAPAWGASDVAGLNLAPHLISILAPAWGASVPV